MSNLNSNSKKTEKSESKSVGKQNDVTSLPSPFPDKGLQEKESRASYFTRKGWKDILEYEKKEFKDKKRLTPQKKKVMIQQVEELKKETDFHVNRLMAYLTQNPDDDLNVEKSVGVKEVDQSLTWLDEIDPDLGQELRQELFFKQKDRYDREKLEMENSDSKSFSGEEKEGRTLQQECIIVSEQPSLVYANRNLGFSKFFLGGFLVLYVLNQIYKEFYKSKNKKKD